MNKKLRNFLFEYLDDSRITTKELGRKIMSSQQSASYLLKSLKKKKIVLFETVIVDAVKLGYVNTLIGFNYVKLDAQSRREILSELKELPEALWVEESKEGADLLVEFATKNLASLDKLHKNFINKFDRQINTAFILPIITKYKCRRKYLRRLKHNLINVLFGDRTFQELSKTEEKVLYALVENPSQKIVELASKTKLHVKSVVKAKKDLEKKFVIKGYGAVFDHKKLEINKEIIFLRFSSEGLKEIDKFIRYAKAHPNIVEIIKTIGSTQIIILVENLKELELVRDIRSRFSIENYLVFKSEKVHKKQYLPLKKI